MRGFGGNFFHPTSALRNTTGDNNTAVGKDLLEKSSVYKGLLVGFLKRQVKENHKGLIYEIISLPHFHNTNLELRGKICSTWNIYVETYYLTITY